MNKQRLKRQRLDRGRGQRKLLKRASKTPWHRPTDSTAFLCCEDEKEKCLSWAEMTGRWAGPLIEITPFFLRDCPVNLATFPLHSLPNRLFLKIALTLFLSNCNLIFWHDESWDFMRVLISRGKGGKNYFWWGFFAAVVDSQDNSLVAWLPHKNKQLSWQLK